MLTIYLIGLIITIIIVAAIPDDDEGFEYYFKVVVAGILWPFFVMFGILFIPLGLLCLMAFISRWFFDKIRKAC
jgi:hypothetical protein